MWIYILWCFKRKALITPAVPPTIIRIGMDLSTESTNSKHIPINRPSKEVIKYIAKNNLGCFLSSFSKYGFDLIATLSPPLGYYSIVIAKGAIPLIEFCLRQSG